MNPVPDDERAFLDHMRDESCAWIARRTVTLLVEERPGLLSQLGTAVLLAIADSVWLISAAHVLDRARRYPFWINPAVPGARPISLDGVAIQLTEDQSKADLGFVELPTAVSAELATTKKFLRLDEVDWEPEPPSGLYGAFGYPATINVRRSTTLQIPTTGMFYVSRSHKWRKPPRPKLFDPALNVAIDFDSRRSRDESGELAAVPDPKGMSGCGLWRLFAYNGDRARWRADLIRLAGIQHGHATKENRPGVLIGVRFRHVLSTMCDASPALRAVLALYQRPDLMIARDVL